MNARGKTHTSVICLLGALLILPISAHADVWYVHPDSLLCRIQTALDSCAENDTVLVAPGTYFENITWPYTRGIDLVSELGRDTTIIDGNHSGRVIECTTGVDTSTKIVGFTVRNGYAEKGAGLHCADSSSPTIKGNNFIANSAYLTGWLGGGGILCEYWSSPLIIDNVIMLNTTSHSGGGVYCYQSSPIIVHNMICENEVAAGGAGIACTDGSDAIISGNVIEMNTAGIGATGIMCDYYSSAHISGNIIRYNAAGSFAGGIGCYTSSPTIVDNTITYNTAGVAAGGIDCGFSSATIRRNDISNNEGSAWQRGGIQVSTNCSVIIDSCTIANNIGNGITIYQNCVAEVHYNDIVDNTGYGMECFGNPSPIDAEYNWWGDPSGPGGAGPGTGDEVSSGVDYRPWLKEPMDTEEEVIHDIRAHAARRTIVSGPLLLPGDAECRIIDITGRIVNPNTIRPGVYFVEVDGNVTRKVVKIR